jgi:hypothetical protein
MAYRGQGQKVQKVMVQPIVSYATCWDWEVWTRKQVETQADSRPKGAECGPTSHEPSGRQSPGESAGS